MHYRFSFPNRVSHFAEIELTVHDISGETIEFHLPSWRPGRYELGNFAKNIRQWKAIGGNGEELAFRKSAKDSWLVNTNGNQTIKIQYSYYCAQPDAGACWIDDQLVYINPVHCCLYIKDRLHEPCSVALEIAIDDKIACSMKQEGDRILTAADFHELVDSPWMAAVDLWHKTYSVHGTLFHIWFHGNVNPDWDKLVHDFSRFSKVQIDTMGGLPVDEYHFLILVLPFRFYHGVEHLRSTVLALGPGHELMDRPLYDDLTGVASHELFHVWNIKQIRPATMLPYDYSKENYSRLGFVYEGNTTYYGDLFLVRSGVYTVEQYFDELKIRLQKHFDSYGRLFLSVADSSFDTWLDGYVPGVPHRKTSIYDEGSLTALMTDLYIRKSTNGKSSLDDVMRILFEDFGKKERGYTELDYQSAVEKVAQYSMSEFFNDYIYGKSPYEPMLSSLLNTVGCDLIRTSAAKVHESKFGFRTGEEKLGCKVMAVLPGSPADRAGVGKDDEIIAVNGEKVEGELSSYFSETSDKDVVLTLINPMKRTKEIVLKTVSERYYHQYSIRRNPNSDEISRDAFKRWTGQDFNS